MATFDRRRAEVSLRKHAIRFQTALRKQDEATLAELVLPRPPAWMLDPKAARGAGLGRISKGNVAPMHAYGACLVATIALGFRAPWSARDRVVVHVVAVSLDRGGAWRFIDGMPDLGRVMGDPAYLGLIRYAAQHSLVSPIFVTVGGGALTFWSPSQKQRHERLLQRMRSAVPRPGARARAMAVMKALARRYQGPLRVTARRAAQSQRVRPLRELDLRASHLTQLRSYAVGWDDVEGGAPVLEPPRLARELSTRARAELLSAFEILLAVGKLRPGAYLCDKKKVEVSAAHARLFPALSVRWDDGDGPGVDPKRPYGYRSYFEYDMADLLGIEPAGTADEDGPKLTRAQEKDLTRLHASMQGAVRALILHGKLAAGRFRKVKGAWTRAPSAGK